MGIWLYGNTSISGQNIMLNSPIQRIDPGVTITRRSLLADQNARRPIIQLPPQNFHSLDLTGLHLPINEPSPALIRIQPPQTPRGNAPSNGAPSKRQPANGANGGIITESIPNTGPQQGNGGSAGNGNNGPSQAAIIPSTDKLPPQKAASEIKTQLDSLLSKKEITLDAYQALELIASTQQLDLSKAVISDGYIFPKVKASNSSGVPTTSEQQCAVLVQALTGRGLTGYWLPDGATLQSGNAKAGDPIATFMANGYYPIRQESMNMKSEAPTAENQPHSGIFLGYLLSNGSPVGFKMLAQSAGTKATIEYRLFQKVPPSSQYAKYNVEHWSYSKISVTAAKIKNTYDGP